MADRESSSKRLICVATCFEYKWFFNSALSWNLISTCNVEGYNEFEQLILSLYASQNKAVYSESNALQITGGSGTDKTIGTTTI